MTQQAPLPTRKTVTFAPTPSPSLSPSPPSSPDHRPVRSRLHDNAPQPDVVDYSPSATQPFGINVPEYVYSKFTKGPGAELRPPRPIPTYPLENVRAPLPRIQETPELVNIEYTY